MQSQINTRLFKLKAGTKETEPHSSELLCQSWLAASILWCGEIYSKCSAPFYFCLSWGALEGSSEGELGKQSLRHCRLGNLRREHVLNSQESQIQTVTFWQWLCDPWETAFTWTWQHLKNNGDTDLLPLCLGCTEQATVWEVFQMVMCHWVQSSISVEELHLSTYMENNSNYFHLRFAPNNISLGFQSHLYMIQQLLRVLKHLGINFLYLQLEICPLHYKMCLNEWCNLYTFMQPTQPKTSRMSHGKAPKR